MYTVHISEWCLWGFALGRVRDGGKSQYTHYKKLDYTTAPNCTSNIFWLVEIVSCSAEFFTFNVDRIARHNNACVFSISSSTCIRCGTLDNGGGQWRGREELLNKVIICVFIAYKKYSCSFEKLRLNHWCHMDYFKDVPTMFLVLGTFQLHCCLWRVRKLLDFIRNILICVPKVNKGLTGLEQHEGE